MACWATLLVWHHTCHCVRSKLRMHLPTERNGHKLLMQLHPERNVSKLISDHDAQKRMGSPGRYISTLVYLDRRWSSFQSAFVAGPVRSPEDLKLYVLRDSSGTYYCGFCHQFSNRSSTNVRNHCEAKHFPNMFTYSCKLCDMTFGANIGLYNHMARAHKKEKRYWCFSFQVHWHLQRTLRAI